MKRISRLTALLASLLVPLFAAAQTGINTGAITPYSDGIKNVINNILVPVLMALAFIVFLWGVYKFFILGASDEGAKGEGRKFTLWGIIGFVIILSVWGIVNIFMSTLGLSVGSPPPFPTIGGSGGNVSAAQTSSYTALQQQYTAASSACAQYGTSSSQCQSADNTYAQALNAYNAMYNGGSAYTPVAGTQCTGNTVYDGSGGCVACTLAGNVPNADHTECVSGSSCPAYTACTTSSGQAGTCDDTGSGNCVPNNTSASNCPAYTACTTSSGQAGTCDDTGSGNCIPDSSSSSGIRTVGPGENCDSYNICPSGYTCDDWGTCS